MQKVHSPLLKATLIKRVNRFVAEILIDNKKLHVYVPNTGRLSELALPGSEILLSPINAKYRYKILYIIKKSFPVMIDSTYSNSLFYELLLNKKVPELCLFDSITREPVYGNHRFDFLLKHINEKSFIELKSCTLFYKKTGSFPDAVSSRASEHIKSLAESGKGKLVFFVLKNDIEIFLPNYHTDFTFYETLKENRSRIDIHAFAVQYDDRLKIRSLREIPVCIPEVKPDGLFLLIIFNSEETVNNDGEIIEKGFYIYCSGTEKNIFRVIKTLKGKNGLKRLLPDKGFSRMKIITDLPVVTDTITTGDVTKQLIKNSGIPLNLQDNNTGSQNIDLVYYKNNPADESWFWDMILELRFGEY